MKAVIIDDEPKARSLLKRLLSDNCPEIKVIEEADDLPKGVGIIHRMNPDIVFLDIEMPGYSGIQLLEFFEPEQINFEIIFTTAYSEYALKAFELNAIDYLVKPLRDDQLATAVRKAIKQIGKSKIGERLEELKNTLKASNLKKIGLPVSNGVLFVEFDDIILLEADRMYTNVFTKSEGKILVSKPMKFFTELLQNVNTFYRPHRSYLINLTHIKQYVNQDGGYIVMDNQKSVAISREKKEEFLEVMQGNL
jgi:two-component system LytT family response regulator